MAPLLVYLLGETGRRNEAVAQLVQMLVEFPVVPLLEGQLEGRMAPED